MKCITLLLMLSGVLAGCASSQAPAKPVSKLSPEVSQGTGFLVRSDGLVLTAFHVVEKGNTIKVRCQGYDLVSAKLGERSQHLDLAVLQTPLTGTPYLPVADPRSTHAGDAVFTMGFPAARYLGTEPKFSGGAISSLTGPGREGARLLISAPTQPGSSGSPVLTMDGTVVGIVTAAVSEEEFAHDTGALPQNLNWAVKIDYATPLFDVPRGLSAPGDRSAVKTPREVVEQASQAVCIVLVAP
jgi:S1-C subfamily serine protease